MSVLTPRLGWTSGALAVVLGASLFFGQTSIAAPSEGEKPAAASKDGAKDAAPSADVKLTKPWSELTSLTDEQKTKLYDVHHKALAKINEIEKQEKADCMALLTDSQKGELKTAMAKDRKDAAVRASARKGGAATQPAK